MELKSGVKVEVVRGRKVPVGSLGTVFWYGEDRFNRYGHRVGIELESGEKVFTSASNVERWYSPEEIAAQEKAEAEREALVQAERDLVKNTLDLANAKSVEGTYQQHAWNDTYQSAIPLLNPSASDEDIQRAVNLSHPRQSSQGMLRWRSGCGIVKIDREAKVVIISESISLCD